MTKPAVCFTPDLKFFRPAVRAAASLLSQDDADGFDLFIVCEEGDVAPGFAALDPALGARIRLLTVDFSRFDAGLAGRGRFSRAVFRRLFLDRILPDSYARLVTVDADMLAARPGLARLADVDLGGRPIAAAYDMIFLMDMNEGALAESFRRHRRAIGLDLATPYFNDGRWSSTAPPGAPKGSPNASSRRCARGRAASPSWSRTPSTPRSPAVSRRCRPARTSWATSFSSTSRAAIAPIVLHFVNLPKPWQYASWRGEARFAEAYRTWFSASPWPEWSAPAPAESARPPRRTAARRRFAERLAAFLAERRFADRPVD